MEKQEDLRQRRTRKLLTQALLALMEEQPFQEISVVDICERAMVHRTTFYAHFDSKQALLRYALRWLQETLVETCRAEYADLHPHSYFLALVRNCLRFVRAHPEIYRKGMAGCSGEEFQMLEQMLADQLTQRLKEPEFRLNLPDWQPEIAAHFYAGAALSLIRWWLDQETPVPDEVLLHHLDCFIPHFTEPEKEGGVPCLVEKNQRAL